MSTENVMYHHPQEPGYWKGSKFLERHFWFLYTNHKQGATPTGIVEREKTLMMVFVCEEGTQYCPVNCIPGLRVVRGDSAHHHNETDGELLIELHYLKGDQMEERPRRIRPTGIMFGIKGDTAAGAPGHRSLGESADYYLVGEDTSHPSQDAQRAFPFWRIGVYGPSESLISEYLPQPQSE